MKILVIMNSSNVAYGGGIVQVILNFCGHIHDSIVFDYAINEKEGSGLHKVFSKMEGKYFRLPNKKKKPLLYIITLYKIYKQGNYDIVHVHGNSANMLLELILSRYCKVKKRIAHCHNSRCSHPIINDFLKPIFKKTYTDAIACSEVAGNWLFGENNFTILHNAIELEAYKFNSDIRKEYRDKLGIDDSTLLLGHVGNINEQKNHEFLIKIYVEIKKVCQSKLILIGDGPLRTSIKELVEDLKIANDVCFLGVRDDVKNWMQAMDVFVFPSKWEGLGMVAIEAQAAGLYVVASTKVPKDIQLTKRVFRIPLSKSEKEWADLIITLFGHHNNRIIDKKDFKFFDLDQEYLELLKIYGVVHNDEKTISNFGEEIFNGKIYKL